MSIMTFPAVRPAQASGRHSVQYLKITGTRSGEPSTLFVDPQTGRLGADVDGDDD
jgi:hypothetical protein